MFRIISLKLLELFHTRTISAVKWHFTSHKLSAAILGGNFFGGTIFCRVLRPLWSQHHIALCDPSASAAQRSTGWNDPWMGVIPRRLLGAAQRSETQHMLWSSVSVWQSVLCLSTHRVQKFNCTFEKVRNKHRHYDYGTIIAFSRIAAYCYQAWHIKLC